MFEKFTPAKADPILGLSKLFNADPRTDKIDLGVGVYKDDSGNTPIMRAVKKAEARLHNEQTSKVYTSLPGPELFRDAMRDLVLADAVPAERVATLQTPGGTGAIRQVLESVKMINPDCTVWISDPSWPTHLSMATHMGFKTRSYPYFDNKTAAVDTAAMMAAFAELKAGDLLLLHGCCHNPTGANIDMDTWKAITDLVIEKGVMPFVDIAYQGFGDGLDEDAAPLRHMASRVPEMYVAASCSKNFGLYRDRVGIAMLIAKDAATAAVVQGNLATLNRLNYSFAPDHGAALVAIILNDPALRAEWMEELGEMRDTMLTIRQNLADALRQQCNSDRFDFIAEHRGMFSRLGLAPELVDRLRDQHGMYLVGDSRINIAGLAGGRYQPFANAVAQVVSVS
ncbi:MAG: aspartate/tyrosine/aromatic aminotransferase [Alphaproteobacteria bacterium]|nr:aspartate/tyrosine/aromatic aminotransferase [Alphaproteobacteria bacterium]